LASGGSSITPGTSASRGSFASRGGTSWTGRRGYVQAHVPELYRELSAQAGGAAPHVYFCGLDRMVSAVRELARGELGIPRKHVHVELYD
jgi:CDP-4-dehydro-6-deoxyglucose reductase, E3